MEFFLQEFSMQLKITRDTLIYENQNNQDFVNLMDDDEMNLYLVDVRIIFLNFNFNFKFKFK